MSVLKAGALMQVDCASFTLRCPQDSTVEGYPMPDATMVLPTLTATTCTAARTLRCSRDDTRFPQALHRSSPMERLGCLPSDEGTQGTWRGTGETGMLGHHYTTVLLQDCERH